MWTESHPFDDDVEDDDDDAAAMDGGIDRCTTYNIDVASLVCSFVVGHWA